MKSICTVEILGVEKNASKSEIKKAYHKVRGTESYVTPGLTLEKAALSSHPDKVAEEDRATAEMRFKSVGQAYDILYDDEKRPHYDTYGMSAFNPRGGGGMGSYGADLDDMLQQMFGMGVGEMPPGFGGGPGSRKPRKGGDEEQNYQVTLEELYKGKTAKFASTKNVVCSHCKGTGGKENAKPKQCGSCQGKGSKVGLRYVGTGIMAPEEVLCSACNGSGKVYKEKERCKRCKGARVTEAKKVLELRIPPGSKEGDRIVLEGEADQIPDQQPGDLVFNLVEIEHGTFRRAGADLSAQMDITLAEALCGFSRVVIKHLDGRGIKLNHRQSKGLVLKPGQVIKLAGEGMPHKKSDMKGDLYLVVHVIFPEDGWLQDDSIVTKLQEILPKSETSISADSVDEVEYDKTATLDDFGAGDDSQGGAWVDEDDEEGGQPQCAQQ
ncbi:domain protein [Lasallia pustulata]|uniref:Domain protein n=1 Tax=Lasallia pustulata TaxID=136370 RepID=A0A1W5D5F3_9LECA|nr:domain protein [Lasallia pustulata]